MGNWNHGHHGQQQWHRPPQKPGIPTWIWIAGIGGVGAAFVVLALVQSVVGKKSRREAEDRRVNEAAAAAHAEEKSAASGHAALASACGVSPGTSLQKAGAGEVRTLCRDAVKNGLTSPSSAEFPGMFDDNKPESPDGCSTVYVSWVEARNAFNAKVRTKYSCTYDPRTGQARARILK